MNRRNLFKAFGSLVALLPIRVSGAEASVAPNLPSQPVPADVGYIDIHIDMLRARTWELTRKFEEQNGSSADAYYRIGVKLLRALNQEAVAHKKNLRLILSERDMYNNRPMIPYHMLAQASVVEVHYSDGSKKVIKNKFNNYVFLNTPLQVSSMQYGSSMHFKF